VDDIPSRVPGKMMNMGFDHNDKLAGLLKRPDANGVAGENRSPNKWNHIHILVKVTKVAEEIYTICGYFTFDNIRLSKPYLDCHGVITSSLGPPIITNLFRRTIPILKDVELEVFFSLLISGRNSLYFR